MQRGTDFICLQETGDELIKKLKCMSNIKYKHVIGRMGWEKATIIHRANYLFVDQIIDNIAPCIDVIDLRLIQVALFKDLINGDIETATFVIVVNVHNMHGDNEKIPAPLKKASILLEKLLKKHNITKCAIIICGDFNRNIDYLNEGLTNAKIKTMTYELSLNVKGSVLLHYQSSVSTCCFAYDSRIIKKYRKYPPIDYVMIGQYDDDTSESSSEVKIRHLIVDANALVARLNNIEVKAGDENSIFTSDHKPVLVMARLSSPAM